MPRACILCLGVPSLKTVTLLQLYVLKSRKMVRKSLVTPRAAVEIIASHRILKVGSRSNPEIDTGLFLCVCAYAYLHRGTSGIRAGGSKIFHRGRGGVNDTLGLKNQWGMPPNSKLF